MEIDKNYDPDAHEKEMIEMITNMLGDSVDPPWNEAYEKWQGMCKYKTPRMFMYVVDTKQNRTILSSGMSLLGYKDDQEFSIADLGEMTHENQRVLVRFQTLRVHQSFFDNPDISYKKGTVYCSTRGIKDVNDKYWLTHQVAEPFQYDANKVMTRYLSTFRILGDYNGEPMETEIYASCKDPKIEKRNREVIRDIKMDMLPALGFTEKQKDVIEHMSIEKLTSLELARIMDLAKRTVENHKSAILKQARSIFPVNSFNTAQDVVEYLIKQKIV